MSQPPKSSSPADAVRQQVVEAAERRFNKHGFKSVTMDDIARELGMSKKTLYQVVPNKQELIDAVLDVDMANDDAQVAKACADSADAVDEMLRIARYFTEQMRETSPAALYDLQKYYRASWERLDAHHNDERIAHVRANLRRGQAEGLYREDIHRELIAHLFVAAPRAFLDVERFPLRQQDWDVILGQFMAYHLNGVVNDRGRALLQEYLTRDTDPTP